MQSPTETYTKIDRSPPSKKPQSIRCLWEQERCKAALFENNNDSPTPTHITRTYNVFEQQLNRAQAELQKLCRRRYGKTTHKKYLSSFSRLNRELQFGVNFNSIKAEKAHAILRAKEPIEVIIVQLAKYPVACRLLITKVNLGYLLTHRLRELHRQETAPPKEVLENVKRAIETLVRVYTQFDVSPLLKKEKGVKTPCFDFTEEHYRFLQYLLHSQLNPKDYQKVNIVIKKVGFDHFMCSFSGKTQFDKFPRLELYLKFRKHVLSYLRQCQRKQDPFKLEQFPKQFKDFLRLVQEMYLDKDSRTPNINLLNRISRNLGITQEELDTYRPIIETLVTFYRCPNTTTPFPKSKSPKSLDFLDLATPQKRQGDDQTQEEKARDIFSGLITWSENLDQRIDYIPVDSHRVLTHYLPAVLEGIEVKKSAELPRLSIKDTLNNINTTLGALFAQTANPTYFEQALDQLNHFIRHGLFKNPTDAELFRDYLVVYFHIRQSIIQAIKRLQCTDGHKLEQKHLNCLSSCTGDFSSNCGSFSKTTGIHFLFQKKPIPEKELLILTNIERLFEQAQELKEKALKSSCNASTLSQLVKKERSEKELREQIRDLLKKKRLPSKKTAKKLQEALIVYYNECRSIKYEKQHSTDANTTEKLKQRQEKAEADMLDALIPVLNVDWKVASIKEHHCGESNVLPAFFLQKQNSFNYIPRDARHVEPGLVSQHIEATGLKQAQKTGPEVKDECRFCTINVPVWMQFFRAAVELGVSIEDILRLFDPNYIATYTAVTQPNNDTELMVASPKI